MKKIVILFLAITSFISFNYISYASDYDFEYINVTYEFLNSNEYNVKYEFKPKMGNDYDKYYLSDDFAYVDTVKTNIELFDLSKTTIENLADMSFILDEEKDYYIEYKGFIKNGKSTQHMICYNSITREKPRYVGDESSSVDIDNFKMTIVNPDLVKLTKDKLINTSDLSIEFGDIIVLTGSKDYENIDYYYNSCIQISPDEVVWKSQQTDYNMVTLWVTIGIFSFAIIFASCYSYIELHPKKNKH